MKKDELRNGMVVETREGNLYLVVGYFITRETGFDLLSNYKESLLNSFYDSLDIMKVYEYKNDRHDNNATTIRALFNREYLTLLWERKEHNLTEREVEILKALQTLGYEWLARDENGKLFSYIHKPEKLNEFWAADGTPPTPIGKDLFTFIKWEDKEPTNIKELLK